jgi:Raf kinase inhibitor-like YbhB/YbcL family protein
MKVAEIHTDYKLLTVTSSAFKVNGEIPPKYTCNGINVSPPLEIKNIPGSAKSLALLVEDPDAPRGTWVHWVMWNIPPSLTIREGAVPGVQGVNDFGVNLYGGPCPPSGTHHYHFKVYALDTLLNLPEGSTKNDLEYALDNHILAYGELVGCYTTNRHPMFSMN